MFLAVSFFPRSFFAPSFLFLSNSLSSVLFFFTNSPRQRGTRRMWQGVRTTGRSDVMVFRSIAQSLLPRVSNASCRCRFFLGLSAGFKVGGCVKETRRKTGRSTKFPLSFSLSLCLSSRSIGRHIDDDCEIERSREVYRVQD